VIIAQSADKTLAGMVWIDDEVPSADLWLQPLATARGRLLDSTTKEPCRHMDLQYSVWVRDLDSAGSFSTANYGKAVTDDEGHFELTGLIVGEIHTLSVLEEWQPSRFPGTSIPVGTVTPQTAAAIELGNFYYRKSRPYQPPTLDEQIASAFDVEESRGSLASKLETAYRDIRLGRQRLLLVFGEPGTSAVREFFRLRFEDPNVRTPLLDFRILLVSTAPAQLTLAAEIARKISPALPAAAHQPDFCLAVVDHAGQLLATANSESLSQDGQFDRGLLLEFIREQSLPPLDARELLAEALRQAAAENKRVIVQETATWCGPCWSLSRFLDEQRSLWEGDYLWVKLDHRWTDAREVAAELRGTPAAMIPWWGMLDADGKLLATSLRADGEGIGFATSYDGRQHVRQMFESTAQRMTPEQIAALVEALKRD
jgi:hypothetical protein